MICIESGIGVVKGALSVVGAALDAWFASEVGLRSWTEVEAVFEQEFWAGAEAAIVQQFWAAVEAEVGWGSWPGVGVEAAPTAEAVFGIVA